MNSKFMPAHEIKEMYTLIDRYEEEIIKQCKNNSLKEYIAYFLNEDNKRYHDKLVVNYFRQALQRQKPELIEWFDRIQILR